MDIVDDVREGWLDLEHSASSSMNPRFLNLPTQMDPDLPHFVAVPSSVTLTGFCGDTAFVRITPAGRDWGVTTNNPAILAAKNFNDSTLLMISRQIGSGLFGPPKPATVTVFDKANPSNSIPVSVDAIGVPAGNC